MFDYMFSSKYGLTLDPKIMIGREKIDKFNKMNITGKELYKYVKLFIGEDTYHKKTFLNTSKYIESIFSMCLYDRINWDLPHIEYFFKKYCTYALCNDLSLKYIYLLVKTYKEEIIYYNDKHPESFYDKEKVKLYKEIIKLAKKYSKNSFDDESTNNW